MAEASEKEIVRRSVVLTPDLDQVIQDLVEEKGESYSACIRLLLRAGIACREEGIGYDKGVVLTGDIAVQLRRIALDLDMTPESLLSRIVTTGLLHWAREATKACNERQALSDLLNREHHESSDPHSG